MYYWRIYQIIGYYQEAVVTHNMMRPDIKIFGIISTGTVEEAYNFYLEFIKKQDKEYEVIYNKHMDYLKNEYMPANCPAFTYIHMDEMGYNEYIRLNNLCGLTNYTNTDKLKECNKYIICKVANHSFKVEYISLKEIRLVKDIFKNDSKPTLIDMMLAHKTIIKCLNFEGAIFSIYDCTKDSELIDNINEALNMYDSYNDEYFEIDEETKERINKTIMCALDFAEKTLSVYTGEYREKG